MTLGTFKVKYSQGIERYFKAIESGDNQVARAIAQSNRNLEEEYQHGIKNNEPELYNQLLKHRSAKAIETKRRVAA